MHSEFTLSDEEQRRADAFAVFSGVSDTMSLDETLYFLDMSRADVAPFVDEWNRLSTKQISLE